jgi:hypothetical protein
VNSMRALKFSLALIMLLAVVSQFFVVMTFAEGDRDAATSALKNAEDATSLAYQTVVKAEKVGANVSDSLAQLNEAGGFLAEAQVAFRLGKYGETVRLANLCYNTGNSVASQAGELQLEASGQQRVDDFVKIGESTIGLIVVGFGSFWAWRIFKRSYYRRALKMKPEVVSDES